MLFVILELRFNLNNNSNNYSHNMKINNISFERAEKFKYLGKNLTNRNSIREEINSRLKSVNACCYSVQNILCFKFL